MYLAERTKPTGDEGDMKGTCSHRRRCLDNTWRRLRKQHGAWRPASMARPLRAGLQRISLFNLFFVYRRWKPRRRVSVRTGLWCGLAAAIRLIASATATGILAHLLSHSIPRRLLKADGCNAQQCPSVVVVVSWHDMDGTQVVVGLRKPSSDVMCKAVNDGSDDHDDGNDVDDVFV